MHEEVLCNLELLCNLESFLYAEYFLLYGHAGRRRGQDPL